MLGVFVLDFISSKDNTENFLESKSESFFYDGIHTLIEMYRKVKKYLRKILRILSNLQLLWMKNFVVDVWDQVWFGLIFLFNGISYLVGYFIPKPSL